MTRKPPRKSATGKAGVPRPDAKAAFLEFEALGHHDEDGNVQTQQWFAGQWGVTEDTLSVWKKAPDWEDRVEELRARLMKSLDRRIWARVGKSIATANDATLFSKRFGLMSPEPDAATGPGITQNFHIHGSAVIDQQREFLKTATGASSADEAFHDTDARKRKTRPRPKTQ